MYAADVASQRLGVVIDEVAPGHAVARMRVTGAMLNGHRICHGGYIFLLADTAFAFACNTFNRVTVAAAADIVFVSSAGEGDELRAVASQRASAGRTGVYDVEVRGADGVVAEFRGLSRSRSEPLLEE